MSTIPERLLTVIVVPNEGLGQAEAPLRLKLIQIYLKLILESSEVPAAFCFYTEGVKLVVEDSPVIVLLKQLEARGVYLISCQTCLKYYGLMDKVRVGVVGGMHDILEVQRRAQKVITI